MDIILDTNLLVLLIAGTLDRRLIRTHKRLADFDEAAFDLLESEVARHERLIVPPNVLTETSNLLSQIKEPARSRLRAALASLVIASREI